ncbi:MAG: D-glycero-beta-D-manno-heptose 1,7-bisphosphate 7-phosphatase [Sulfurimonas sp.]|uniref:D-glycero-beta-D-manno-heptose 1,7-bisphosphate 7-phosphatase n=1 Tax=Sulfurimonas sp. TaxID=2022749 RepID=UPI0025E50EA0|nr:D-glycero-beta-D-manno-heptose 1,7-bisphosphate 7-phosphatase [Sulfurimonas sp.]MCK9492353.1 D-glycero-beta-D-manno-heptose 1,7-bisphosphate 7-phosphatase [Sulfurimonas sp.]
MNKALFLDRDGVINVEKEYLYKIDDFEFIDGIFDLCRYYQDLGFIIVVVTNQSGIARGYYSEDDFETLTSWMKGEFLKQDILISKVYYCPHYPKISGKCSCRKPSPGMILDASRDLNINLSESIIVGDKERDIEAGIAAGLKCGYLFDESNNIRVSKANKIISKFKDIYDVNSQ